jgi:transposase
VERTRADGTLERIALGYECSVQLTAVVEGWPQTWTERRLLVQSLAQARTAETALRRRLAQAQAALAELTVARRGKARLRDALTAQQLLDAILTRFAVAEVLGVRVREQVEQRRLRPYRERPARLQEHRTVSITPTVDSVALEAAIARLGWRVYATNQSAEQLSLAQAVLAYREEYLIERGMGRLKGQPLSLRPMYVERDDHATGLIRLLTIGLRVLTVLEFVVRRRLAHEGESVAGLCRQSQTCHHAAHHRAVAAGLRGHHAQHHCGARPGTSSCDCSFATPATDFGIAGFSADHLFQTLH